VRCIQKRAVRVCGCGERREKKREREKPMLSQILLSLLSFRCLSLSLSVCVCVCVLLCVRFTLVERDMSPMRRPSAQPCSPLCASWSRSDRVTLLKDTSIALPFRHTHTHTQAHTHTSARTHTEWPVTAVCTALHVHSPLFLSLSLLSLNQIASWTTDSGPIETCVRRSLNPGAVYCN